MQIVRDVPLTFLLLLLLIFGITTACSALFVAFLSQYDQEGKDSGTEDTCTWTSSSISLFGSASSARD